jgi:hypothetical protein
MIAKENEIDSEVFGRKVLDIADFEHDSDFSAFEEAYQKRENPIYVTCKVPAEDIASVHSLEDHGFRFIEFQVRLRGTIRKMYDVSAYNYSYLPVTGGKDLDAVLDLASTIFEHDRISRDPFFEQWRNRNISGERYRRYVLKSINAPDEFVYQLVDNATGEVVGFSTHRIVTPETALLLIGGVRNQEKMSGAGVINDYFALNELNQKGIKNFHTHMSGANYPIMNLEIKGLGFRIIQSFVVLRKTYS